MSDTCHPADCDPDCPGIEGEESKVNLTIIMFAVYAVGSLFFLAGSAIGIAVELGLLK